MGVDTLKLNAVHCRLVKWRLEQMKSTHWPRRK